ncbi:Na+/H+ antiporter subunit E [Rhodobacter sp. Har01]|uniref:Na+/H+ antiporter subunit E n=1 Tax=Rhodobacter sp. Har01 TaxID=2883999 RepID=UPI001D091EF2|nr:Na+/H+ antiporter subunit E [Rhodobacter sp. Har01]MCB6179620.1 Na+/H+ antiporter subunit E [Rhodobacter sp. Har01]
MTRLLPHPGLTLFLTLFWLVLANSWTLNSLLLALAVGVLIPLVTAPWWPHRPRMARPWLLVPYTVLVLWDVIVANFQVAWVILFLRSDRIRSAFISVPVDLTQPEAITLLAGTITMTPGTLTADWSADGRSLLIHALHAPDPDAVRDQIKTRYEARLKRIFT